MTEGERNQLLNRVFAVIRARAAELRKSGDYYDGCYSADELVKLPGYIVPRLNVEPAPDLVVIDRGDFESLWQMAYAGAEETAWLDELLDLVEEQRPQVEA